MASSARTSPAQLVERGDDVRVWIRESSSTVAFDDLAVERQYGDLGDRAALRDAMRGIETVFYCIVDTRAWLRDPTPLFATNVEALRQVLDVAVEVGVPKFVFCSTVGTIGIATRASPTRTCRTTGDTSAGAYIESRLQAEELVLTYQREHGLPAVVLNVGTTYGPRDHVPTPHGKLVRAAAQGTMPAYVGAPRWRSSASRTRPPPSCWPRRRAASGALHRLRGLPADQGPLRIAADEGGVEPPRVGIPLPLMRVIGVVGGAVSRLRGTDSVVTSTSVRLMHIQSALDHAKAARELGWEPAPTEDAIRAGVRWFLSQRRPTR